MKPLVHVKELLNLKEQAQKKLAEQGKKTQVKVHLGTCGISSGANKVLEAFQHEVEARKLADDIVLRAACIGLCRREPRLRLFTPKMGR